MRDFVRVDYREGVDHTMIVDTEASWSDVVCGAGQWWPEDEEEKRTKIKCLIHLAHAHQNA